MFVSEVARHGDGRTAGLTNHTHGFLGVVVFVQVRNQNIGAFSSESERHRSTDATVTAGDQRLLACKAVGALVRMLSIVWPRVHLRFAAWIGLCLRGIRWPRLRVGRIF